MFDFDLRRFAGWVRANPAVERVAIDWQTYRGGRAFREQLAALARFDELTGRRISYLINGSSTMQRHLEIYRAVADGQPLRHQPASGALLEAPE